LLEGGVNPLTPFAVLRKETIPFTHPRLRVVSRTKWQVIITEKYHVAFSPIVFKFIGVLSPGVFNSVAG
jgi:hypothetical protein